MNKLLKRRILSFKYAGEGVATLFKTQPNAVIHLVVLLIVVGFGWWLKISTMEWLILLLTFSMVLVAEALNTALEFLTDLVSPNYHELAKKTKDVAAGAVLIAVFFAIVIGILIFLPKIINLF
ncbi:MAG: diacylglycerol kinase family protein [Bacteroidota bacterium]